MRILYPILFVTALGFILGSLAQACNQEMYDRIYKEIVLRAMQYDTENWEEERNAIEQEHFAIDNLRKLCNNQKSTYEDKHD